MDILILLVSQPDIGCFRGYCGPKEPILPPSVYPRASWRTRRPRSTIENSSAEGNCSCSTAYSGLFCSSWPSSAPVQAAVDLVTLPTREGTQLTIYNSEDITMVREHRLLTVKEGVNRIQFSWANTLIDPTSHRVPHPRPAGQGRSGRHHLSRRPQRRPAMEHQEPDRRQDPRRDPLFYLGHHLGRRLRGHRQRGRNEAGRDRLRAGDEQLGRAVRQCPDAAGGGQDQPRGEDRRSGEEAAAGTPGRDL